MSSKIDTQRFFMAGDEWLYYKIYSGPKTADALMVEIIKPLIEEALIQEIIDRWFFIRYADPHLHLRLRFHLANKDRIADFVKRMAVLIKPWIVDDLISKIQIDTYQRELERYGSATISLIERLFYHDSQMHLEALPFFRSDQGETLRWLFGLRAIDCYLESFGLDITEKIDLSKGVKENFLLEFGGGKSLKIILDTKFRRERPRIIKIWNGDQNPEGGWPELLRLIEMRMQKDAPIIHEIRARRNGNPDGPVWKDLITSCVHMSVNRLFRVSQRLHELVLYGFLLAQYQSLLARSKTS